jgi:hypothetical protein
MSIILMWNRNLGIQLCFCLTFGEFLNGAFDI